MKLVEIKNAVVFKQRSFDLDRQSNNMFIEFCSYPKHGSVYTQNSEELARVGRVTLQFDKNADPIQWGFYKDVVDQSILNERLYNSLVEYLPLEKAIKDFKELIITNPEEGQKVVMKTITTEEGLEVQIPDLAPSPYHDMYEIATKRTEQQLLMAGLFSYSSVNNFLYWAVAQFDLNIEDIKLVTV